MIDIVQMPPRIVIGVPVLAPFDHLSSLVPEAWATAFSSLPDDDRDFAEASVRVGDRYHEVVGILADDGARIDGFVHALVPGGPYGHLRHEGTRAGIAAAFGEIEAWLRSSGRPPGAAKLDIGYRRDGSDTVHDLFVSLA
ncbi:AraC family transcriptional regulator [Labedella phragmitis]|uniref:AraC family transcriptional regulator n=1 Tax=Labedella phragmitis TaxID=2498849 RepID=A0A444PX70_9MICO|nr:GyrI-like domain-containing protein [Labedella phragmitis]RWZ52499.1 AraC family transcriptional regulator [Labedella phragmitis]